MISLSGRPFKQKHLCRSMIGHKSRKLFNFKIACLNTFNLRLLNFVMLNVAVISLTACVSLLPEPKLADVVYRLETNVQSSVAQTGAPVIRIDRPTVGAELRGADIVLSGLEAQLTIADGAVWSDTIPSLIQRSLFDVLSSREGLVGVLPNSGARPTYRVSLNIRAFEAEFDKGPDFAPRVIAHYSAVLSDGTSRKLIATYDVQKESRANAASVSEIVKAQSSANQDALLEIADWLKESLIAYNSRS